MSAPFSPGPSTPAGASHALTAARGTLSPGIIDGAPPVSTQVSTQALLMMWLSPGFPVGAYAYSHGLEWAAESGLVTDRTSLESWLACLLSHGSVRNDLILIAESWRAAASPFDAARVANANALALALQPSPERRLEQTAQGRAFLDAVRAAFPCPAIAHLDALRLDEIAYCVALGVAGAGHAIAMHDLLPAVALAFCQAQVSAAIRLGITGQTDGQRILAALQPAIQATAATAARLGPDDVGSAVWSADLASLLHETQYTRLFRT